ncbi:MAG: methyltransferase [Proteobacteria bacterium]|nr:methyltransferase [Pseudomonadota bacterium]
MHRGFVGLFIAAALFGTACEKTSAGSEAGSGGSAKARTTDLTRDQQVFDAQRRPDKIVEALALKPGSRVADVGAGSGLLTVHLARAVAPNGKVVATDIDSVVLDNFLKPRLTSAGLLDLVEPRLVSGDAPGLEPNSYDAILLAEVDHYFTDPVVWLKAAATALKPGGRIVITNRTHRSAKSLASAQKAGLKLLSETTPEPSHFIAVYIVEKP